MTDRTVAEELVDLDPSDLTARAEVWARRTERILIAMAERAEAGAHVSGEMAVGIAVATSTLAQTWATLAMNEGRP